MKNVLIALGIGVIGLAGAVISRVFKKKGDDEGAKVVETVVEETKETLKEVRESMKTSVSETIEDVTGGVRIISDMIFGNRETANDILECAKGIDEAHREKFVRGQVKMDNLSSIFVISGTGLVVGSFFIRFFKGRRAKNWSVLYLS